MSDNQDALRCAGWCDEHSSGAYRTSAEAAAHIRRLVAENEVLEPESDAAMTRPSGASVRILCESEPKAKSPSSRSQRGERQANLIEETTGSQGGAATASRLAFRA